LQVQNPVILNTARNHKGPQTKKYWSKRQAKTATVRTAKVQNGDSWPSQNGDNKLIQGSNDEKYVVCHTYCLYAGCCCVTDINSHHVPA